MRLSLTTRSTEFVWDWFVTFSAKREKRLGGAPLWSCRDARPSSPRIPHSPSFHRGMGRACNFVVTRTRLSAFHTGRGAHLGGGWGTLEAAHVIGVE